jgi:hypothetical protein
MADGSTRSIEEVKVGDEVLSVDPATEQATTAKVLAVETHAADGYPMVSIDGVEIGASQPLVVGDRLVPAGLVVKGDQLRKLDEEGGHVVGSKVKKVSSTAVEDAPDPSTGTVYSLEVDGSETYFARNIVVANKVK